MEENCLSAKSQVIWILVRWLFIPNRPRSCWHSSYKLWFIIYAFLKYKKVEENELPVDENIAQLNNWIKVNKIS
jgi:hypothetical protein